MKFFSAEELERFYQKPITEISPTDTPETEYVIGQGTLDCRECGSTLETKCGSTLATYEEAYCDSCDILYKRRRETVSEDTDYSMKSYRTDEREQYICRYCKKSHPITVPDRDWSYETQADIHSYEEMSIKCPCGKRIAIFNGYLPITVSCENCDREYSVTQDQ